VIVADATTPPVTVPVDDPIATELLLLLQVPPLIEVDSVAVEPEQIEDDDGNMFAGPVVRENGLEGLPFATTSTAYVPSGTPNRSKVAVSGAAPLITPVLFQLVVRA